MDFENWAGCSALVRIIEPERGDDNVHLEKWVDRPVRTDVYLNIYQQDWPEVVEIKRVNALKDPIQIMDALSTIYHKANGEESNSYPQTFKDMAYSLMQFHEESPWLSMRYLVKWNKKFPSLYINVDGFLGDIQEKV
jgi:hypothetical protein